MARRFNTRPATNEDLSNADVSTSFFFGAMVAGKDAEIPPTLFPVWADVRDILVFIRITYEPILLQVRPVAQALYEIIVRQKNERYALCNGNVDYQILANTARELFPDLAKSWCHPFWKAGREAEYRGDIYDRRQQGGEETGLAMWATRISLWRWFLIHACSDGSLDKMVTDTAQSFIHVRASKA